MNDLYVRLFDYIAHSINRNITCGIIGTVDGRGEGESDGDLSQRTLDRERRLREEV